MIPSGSSIDPKSVTRAQVVEGLRGFLTRETTFSDPAFFTEDRDLIQAGVMDSLLLMSIIAHAETMIGRPIDLVELGEEQIKSVGALADTVMRALDQPPPA